MKRIKRIFIILAFSLFFAVSAVDEDKIKNRRITPVVFTIENVPQYGRRIPMKRHYQPDYLIRLI